ncbi:cytochrome C oxidase subunit III [Anaplasma phagocytophilum str. MRK]|uniref:cytochrome c oxidase subunit 3 n=1 Tax=Anaplasma phagocytophilum TaxID=948 RepID=UPI0005338DDE|nr:cytochrome c oxidase subunit 3 [Anaplasma phagocytophilum]KDB56418.1 cytochrome C oxidase subunit III [Anaplasma phagocytophilum str. MRK]
MKKQHDHHILSSSPWPIFLSICAFITAFGLVGVIHKTVTGLVLFSCGTAATICVLYCWWRDVVVEAIRDKCFTFIVKKGLRIGLSMLILSETMFFFAFFWSFFKAWLFPAYQLVDYSQKVATVWPPVGIETVSAWSLPFMNTVTLLLSGCTITWSHHYLMIDDIKSSLKMLAFTIGLGLVFSTFQLIEYLHAGFAFSEVGLKAVYSSNFYMATGFHGLHVLMGIVFLIVCWIRMFRGQMSSDCHIGFECAAWYWHFVDVVWLFLFLFMYVISS